MRADSKTEAAKDSQGTAGGYYKNGGGKQILY